MNIFFFTYKTFVFVSVCFSGIIFEIFYLLREMAIIIQTTFHAFILSNDKRKSKISYNYVCILSNNNLQT